MSVRAPHGFFHCRNFIRRDGHPFAPVLQHGGISRFAVKISQPRNFAPVGHHQQLVAHKQFIRLIFHRIELPPSARLPWKANGLQIGVAQKRVRIDLLNRQPEIPLDFFPVLHAALRREQLDHRFPLVYAAFPRQRLHVRRIDLPRPAAQRHAHDLQHAEIHIRNVHLRIFLITPRTMFFSLSSIASRYSPTAYTAAYGTANVTTPA